MFPCIHTNSKGHTERRFRCRCSNFNLAAGAGAYRSRFCVRHSKIGFNVVDRPAYTNLGDNKRWHDAHNLNEASIQDDL